MLGKRLINTKVAGGGGCTDIVDNYDPFGGNGVALYQLNGDATDVSGNYNGTASNVTYGTGVFGQAGVFNGSSSYISGLPTLTNISGSYSISVWAKFSSTPSSNSYVFGGIKEQGASDSLIGVFVNTSNNIVFRTRGSNVGTIHDIISSSNYLGQWHNIVVTQDSSKMELYIDGASIGTLSVSPTITLDNCVIGASNGRGTIEDYFTGSIDQVRIFNEVLTPLEVEALYTEELCICDGTVDTLDILGDGSCIATYQLDGNANDLSGNYSGTPTDVSYGVGEFDLAGVFNGTSSSITFPQIYSSAHTNSNTVSLWFKTTDNSNLITLIDAGISPGWILYVENGFLDLAYYSFPNNGDTFGSTNIADGLWHNVAVVIDNSNGQAKVYLDGNSTAEITHNFTANTSVVSFTSNWYIGETDGNIRYFNGSIDQVRIFNKALSAGEVTTLYNETACTKAACTGTTNTLDILGDGSCIAAYPLDGSPADLSGNYNGVQTDVTYPQGYFDLAGSFNGISSYVKNDNLANEIFKAPFTINLWANTSVSQTNKSILHIQDDNNGHLPIVNIFPQSTGYQINVRTNSAATLAEVFNVPLTYNSWEMITVVLLSNGAKFYKNAVEIASFSFTPVFTTNTSSEFNLGRTNQRWVPYVGNYYQGSIDQVRVFNKALSAGEVTTLYNETPCN